MRFEPGGDWSLDTLQQREWLETDGLGNYASGTVSGIHTRRYHGLLVADGGRGTGRQVLCAKLDESLFCRGQRRELGANQYLDTIHPQGYLDLIEFRLDPWPIWTWRAGEVVFEKQLAMLAGRATTVVAYRVIEPAAPVGIELRPLVAARGYHTVAFESWSFRRQALWQGRRLSLEPYDDVAPVCLQFSDGHFESEGYWWHNFLYARERDRLLEDQEDLFCPGIVAATIHPGEALYVAAHCGKLGSFDGEAELAAERARRAAAVAGLEGEPGLRLSIAAEAFRIRRHERPHVIAGYPWFEPRLRDALIALPGLTAGTNLAGERTALLAALCETVRANGDAQAYGDAPLWLAWCAEQTRDAGALPCPERLRPALEALVARVQQAAQPGLRTEHDGLLAVSPERPATWMNAMLDGASVTPRTGKPVETNALWYLVLRQLGELTGDEVIARRADRVQAVLRDRFWSDARGWLADVVDGPAGDDAALRPNQLIAVAVPNLLPDAVSGRIMTAVGARLLTPFGLRTLDPSDPRYRGAYAGDWRSRDEAYHNGSVWPWLLGPWADGLRHFNPGQPRLLAELLEPFGPHLREHGLGQVSELFWGDPPHRPSGAVAQAVSVAELRRIAAMAGELET